MIKQIQLRGISRDPSDRSNADGGCAESLNVHLNEGELAPAPFPKDITSTIGVDSSFKALYIHKVGDMTNYIGMIGTSIYAKVEGVTNPVLIISLGAAPESITSIGNILVWTLPTLGTYYAIFRDGTYTYLGNSIPEPTVTFSTNSGTQVTEDFDIEIPAALASVIGSMTTDLAWNWVYNHVGQSGSDAVDAANDVYNECNKRLWATVDSARVRCRGNNEFTAPVLARYALKLYDGNYIYVSAPVLLMGKSSGPHAQFYEDMNTGNNLFRFRMRFENTFFASVRVDFGSAGLWGDLIESVDVFISTDILVPKANAKMLGCYKNHDSRYSYTGISFEFEGVSDYSWVPLMEDVEEGHPYLTPADFPNRFKEDFETAMLEKGNFYKVASIPAFQQAYWVEDIKPKAQDDLVVLPRLSEGDAHQVDGLGGLGSYNNRLILTGEKVTLSRGNQKPDALLPVGDYTGTTNVSGFFYIRTSDGGTKVVKGYSAYNVIDKERVRAYITYPDSRCFKAEYYVPALSGYTKVTIPMKEHPRINASYGFWGLGLRLDELLEGDTRTSEAAQSVPTDEDRTYEEDNRLFLSEVDNPFFFPLGQRVTFSSKILSAMPITVPLSTGQFGQYQLYVFTQDGIWAETITDEGKIAASHPVTRDAPFEGAIAQLDQGIVFASGSGVMLMYGSQVTNISPAMIARRDVLGDASAHLSDLGDWTDLMTIAMDDTSFLEYIKQARFVYDYPGKRILVFRSDKNYAWVYKLDTSTWHKQQLPSGKYFSNALNSYPEALVTMLSSGSASVIDFTTEYGSNTYPVRTALVITRNLDLGEPDVRKEIRALKVRASYRMGGSTKVILLGSMDGRFFKQLKSLHNGSYKFYKLILLMKLFPDERVGWVDIDHDVRFTNKLR